VTGKLALEGVRVLDLTWVIAGPVSTKLLADQGAEVIKLESERSMDPGRIMGPWLNGVNTSPDGGGSFTLLNRNKLSATLNLKHETGKELFKKLAAVSDVVVNNYSAGTMKGFGLGWDVLRELNPRLIMCEMSGFGQDGLYSERVAYGQTLMALAGGYELTGYPEGEPQMPGYTYADFAAPHLAAFAITSALISRESTGFGQYIDLSQFQVAAALMAEPQLEALYNNANPARMGNFEPGTFVHGVFRCLGEDRWAVVVARTEADWAALRAVITTLPEDPEALSLQARDELVEAWTQGRSADDVMEVLQAAGVEAAKVQNAQDLVDSDPHVRERGYYEWYDHLLGEKALVDGVAFKMSATPGGVRKPGPPYGIDNSYVFGDLLGLSEEDILRLREEGVIK
jgi:crotonobetainyl-CoA:carnitine CoA-transferase CaiB-like acyl-CoA transferase